MEGAHSDSTGDRSWLWGSGGKAPIKSAPHRRSCGRLSLALRAGRHHRRCLRATPPGQGSGVLSVALALPHLSVPAAWEAKQVLEAEEITSIGETSEPVV